MVHDDTPMVRRAAAQQLGRFAAVVEPDLVSRELVQLFQDMTQDDQVRGRGPAFPPPQGRAPGPADVASMPYRTLPTGTAPQDSVRLLAVESCGDFAKLLPRSDVSNTVLPIVKRFSEDKSWRVRYNVAQQLHLIAEALGADLGRQELLPSFIKLLRDGESEVRVSAAGKCAAFCSAIKYQVGPRARRIRLSRDFRCVCGPRGRGVPRPMWALVGFGQGPLGPLPDHRPLPACGLADCCRYPSHPAYPSYPTAPLLVPFLQQAVTSVMPVVKELAADSSQQVRSAVAGSLMEMTPDLGKNDTIQVRP